MRRHAGERHGRFTRRQWLAMLGAGAAGLVGLPVYAFGIEPHWVELVTRPMPLRALPPALAGRTLLQVSDLHVGPRVDADYLSRALGDAARLEPDIVCITGDFVTWRGPRQGEVALAPGRTLYVNRGLGHLTPVRFNVRPELTLFTLVPEVG